jgi:KEOPS complex subunit Cgi121
MKLVCGKVTIEDVDEFVSIVDKIEKGTGATIQAFDARYIVNQKHIKRAIECADRARRRNNNIARDRSIEMLLYAAGRRQITEALEIGVSSGLNRIVVAIDGGNEIEAAKSIESNALDTPADEVLGSYDPDLVQPYFDITANEIDVVNGDTESLVLERVALLAVER